MTGMARTTDTGELGESSATIARSIGTVVAGTYRLTRHIGSGGSSHVFEAEHVRLGKPFAVKLLRPELDPTRQTAQRFRREARAIAKLSSEYIVSVVDCGELSDQTPYLAMELLEGEDLRSLLKRERSLPARRAVPIIVEACRALTEAHGAGLVHRDLKPENLFIARRATGEDWCKVLDFGVAKMDASMSTTQGAIVGTVRYMAPEQLADGAKVDFATDIHALGAILYECLSGRPAHTGDTIQKAMFSVLNKQPPPLESVPPALSGAVLRCLSKDPAKRPRSARALEELLSATLSPRASEAADHTHSEDAPPAGMPRGQRKPRGRAKGLLVPAGLGLALSFSILAWFSSKKPAPPAAAVSPPTPAATASNSTHVVTALVAPAAAASATASADTSARPPPNSAHVSPRAAIAPAAPSGARLHAPTRPAVGNLDSANPYSE